MLESLSIQEATQILKILGDERRLTMLKLLHHDTVCVCEFVEIFQISQPAISQHLRKLRDVGIVKEERKGQWIFYSLDESHELYPLMEVILQSVENQKDKLDQLEAAGLRVDCCS